MVLLFISLVKSSKPTVWAAIYSYTKEPPMVMLLDFSFGHFIKVLFVCFILSSLSCYNIACFWPSYSAILINSENISLHLYGKNECMLESKIHLSSNQGSATFELLVNLWSQFLDV